MLMEIEVDNAFVNISIGLPLERICKYQHQISFAVHEDKFFFGEICLVHEYIILYIYIIYLLYNLFIYQSSISTVD